MSTGPGYTADIDTFLNARPSNLCSHSKRATSCRTGSLKI
jgi:hypothetical protein